METKIAEKYNGTWLTGDIDRREEDVRSIAELVREKPIKPIYHGQQDLGQGAEMALENYRKEYFQK